MRSKVGITCLFAVAFLVLGSFSWAEKAAAKPKKKKMAAGTYAVFETSLGTVTCELFEDKAPKTVANFTGLAEGTKEWTDPATGQKVKKKFYDGLVFHRVIPDFMIQGGDPAGNGTGGPGYRFENEFDDSLQFDRIGRLAMANAGRDTNGSQFFITVKETSLKYRDYTIFGQVVEGQEVADRISKVARDNRDKPTEPVVMKNVTIKRVKGSKSKEQVKK